MFSHLTAVVKRYLMTKNNYRFFVRSLMNVKNVDHARQVLETNAFYRVFEPIQMLGPDASQLCVVAPHPDDDTIGPGGTLIMARDLNRSVHAVYVTSGDARKNEKDLRKGEANMLCDSLGFDRTFLDQDADAIPCDLDFLRVFANAIKSKRPDALFVPFYMDDHNDHRRIGHLILLAQRAGLLDGFNPEIWAYQIYTALPGNVVVDITSVAERKADAIRHHKSQFKIRDWAHWALGLNAFHSRLLRRHKDQRYVECFFVLPFKEYLEHLAEFFDVDPDQAYCDQAYRND